MGGRKSRYSSSTDEEEIDGIIRRLEKKWRKSNENVVATRNLIGKRSKPDEVRPPVIHSDNQNRWQEIYTGGLPHTEKRELVGKKLQRPVQATEGIERDEITLERATGITEPEPSSLELRQEPFTAGPGQQPQAPLIHVRPVAGGLEYS
ncbi:hypothetical protein QAD02_014899 [Eretmocerus hayati]|uniref:Uncharacterized protein n=1 Tax=Eretmocerus hayati TaxID=131215 RepID=A0ACC2P6S3_9HYME|nr:hypothetical protein QAD02_014899 [Eretmocerus hayati]